jgi:ABC-type glycerol-3-phosphate transport system permease component
MFKKLYEKYRMANPKKAAVNRFTRSKFGNVMILVLIISAGLFSMLPLIYAVVTSFKPIDELLIFPPTFFVRRPTTVNYVALPTLLSSLSVPLSRYIFNSIFITLVTSVLNILFSAMAAFSLSKGKWGGRGIIFMVIQFALMFNAYTLSVPQYFIFSKLGIVDTYWVYILPQLAGTLGVFLIKQYIEGYVPDALMEAAKIDGAGYGKIFWRIVMPIIKPAWLTVLLFAFPAIWSAIPNGTIFNEELKTLPQIVTQITAGGTARAGSAMAVTTIMMIPPVIVYLISQSNVVEAMSSAGIKDM